VNRIRPSRPQGHLNPVFAAARAANQLNAVQNRSWSQLLPEGEFQLGEVGKNFADEVWVAGVCHVVIRVAAWTQNIPGYRCNKEELIFAEFGDQLLQQFNGVVKGALRRYHQVTFEVVTIVLWNAF
jgi:hypothetical protein